MYLSLCSIDFTHAIKDINYSATMSNCMLFVFLFKWIHQDLWWNIFLFNVLCDLNPIVKAKGRKHSFVEDNSYTIIDPKASTKQICKKYKIHQPILDSFPSLQIIEQLLLNMLQVWLIHCRCMLHWNLLFSP